MEQSKKVCLFAHYHNEEKIEVYVQEYLRAIQQFGFDIIFISNSKVKRDYKKKLSDSGISCKILERENKGNDFGAWQYAFREGLISPETDNILLTNDSIIGPLFDLNSLFQSMNNKGLDFWGLTDSYQGEWHLQSYFIWLTKAVFSSETFKNFFTRSFDYTNKDSIIKHGEIALSQELVKSGFNGEAFVPYKKMDDITDSSFSSNPTHFFWEKLIKQYQFPFIKKELILKNPEDILSLGSLFSVIREQTNYNVDNLKGLLINNNKVNEVQTGYDHVNVVCHLYYPHSIYYFLSKLAALKKYNANFYFNLSYTLIQDNDFLEVLKASFPGAVIINAPDKGRDIGGKFALMDIMLKRGVVNGYTLVIHDKYSGHTPTGQLWRDKLFKVMDDKELPGIFSTFDNDATVGIIGTKDFIKSEYNSDKETFDCTSSDILLEQIRRYNLQVNDYRFLAGSIFWIRNEILYNFFTKHNALEIRKKFETGNALDFVNGTLIHSWERLFSMIATSEKYKIKGI